MNSTTPRHPWPFPSSAHTPKPAEPKPTEKPVDGGLNLEDDKPLTGGACDLDGPCESCQ